MAERTSAPAAPLGEPQAQLTAHAGREALDEGIRILKHAETFAVFNRHGDAVPGATGHGLYHEGMRHLSMLTLDMAGARPLLLKSTISSDNLLLAIDLTNPDLVHHCGVAADTLHVFRSKIVRDGVLHERLRITNHGMEPITVPVTWRFGADFADVFEVRGMDRPRRGYRISPDVGPSGVRLAYRGLDGAVRRTDILTTPRPARVASGEVRHEIVLEPKQEITLELHVSCARGEATSFDDAWQAARARRTAERERAPRIRSSNELFNRWIDRSLADFYMMLTATEHGPYPYAGIPWYSTPFGRDGILTALFALWLDPEPARGVLGFLAAMQADCADPSRDAEPGKIVHEIRRGEMAALGEVPFGRYYGTIDATPLYVVLAGAYHARTGDQETIRALWPHLERALSWIDETAARDPRGFVAYARASTNGLVQQGWKDSDTSVFHADGTLARGPIALCEVQAYVFAAKRSAAALARALGHEAAARRLDDEAEALRARFEAHFWSEELGTYVLALDGDGRPCAVRTSNAGHVLFGGLAAPLRARRVGDMLLDGAMFNGWGVRTVATTERRYNPMSYHNGSVWPHDTAIVAAGLARYGMKKEALTIFSALFDTSLYMDLHRMPELICGFARKTGQGPTLYPVACSPQAWAAAAPFLLLEACLGLELDARARQIRLADPRLPHWLDWLELRDVRLAGGDVDLVLRRDRDRVLVEKTGGSGEIELVVI